MNFLGVIIEESLDDKSILKKIKILNTKVEKVVKKHKTPWLLQWTKHKVEIPENQAEAIANELSLALAKSHPWYVDFKNDMIHYIIFLNRIFKINRKSKKQYKQAKKYGISLGIPDYQVDFSPEIK